MQVKLSNTLIFQTFSSTLKQAFKKKVQEGLLSNLNFKTFWIALNSTYDHYYLFSRFKLF